MKRSAHFLAALALFLSCTLLLSTFTGHGMLLVSRTEGGFDTALPTVILDAGHGGEDGGATGVNGVLEKELNLSLSKMLAALFRLAGYPVVETRTTDTLLCGENAQRGQKKQKDLENRLAFTEKYENSVLISIHMNTFPDHACEGLQVWYSTASPLSKTLADTVQEQVKDVLQPNNHRRTKAAGSAIYLLHRSRVPAILIECGFLSSEDECARLCDAEYRRRLALVIFTALTEKIPPATCEEGKKMI